MTIVIPPNLTSGNLELLLRSPDLNPSMTHTIIDRIVGASGKTRPIARYVGTDDIKDPPAPAWYIPAANDIYIHVDDAGITNVPAIDWRDIHDTTDPNLARILGLFCHEAGHAAISDHMTPVQKSAMRHFGLLNLLEELRVENYALRRAADARRFLRASFGIVLAGLPDTFETKGHVAMVWTIARGRTLSGVAAADETDAVDLAARTILGDDVVDGLTDLLQEALTVRLDREGGPERMIEICDEWVELVGETAETTGCTHCAREATEADKDASGEPTDVTPDEAEPEPDEGDGGADEDTGTDTDTAVDDAEKGSSEERGDGSAWGEAGYEAPEGGDPDEGGGERLDDEAAELMSMLARDLADLMQDEWTRDVTAVELAKPGEWAQKIFGNRKRSGRLEQTAPTGAMRQHVVQVAQALSRLSLPAITKTAKQSEVPPGRLRSREALRASAERAQGRMVTARPWKGTVRRHTTARPLVVGVATDTSGSMKWAEDGVAEFAYVYTNAGHRIGARTAAVTFGDHVHRIARPGEVMTHVERKSANDGSEAFDHAMAALDGVLHLTAPAYAARILLVISDGALVRGGEPDKAAEWLRRMDKVGTHVLWIGDRDSSSYDTWLRKSARTLPHVTLVDIESTGRRRRHLGLGVPVFDRLNEAALAAIAAHVTV